MTSRSEPRLWPATLDLRDPVRRGLAWLKASDAQAYAQEVGGYAHGDFTGRQVDAFALVRQVLGEAEAGPEEERTRRFLVSLFDQTDGLSWRPELSFQRRSACMFDQSSVLFGMVTWFMESRGPRVAEHLERMIDGLSGIAEWHDGWCLYPLDLYTPTGWTEDYQHNQTADPCHGAGKQIMPLVRYYELTGYAKALRLAEGLAEFVVHHSGVFDPKDGGFWGTGEFASGHVHSRLGTAAGIARLGLATGRPDLVVWAKKVLDWALSHVTSRFGWVAEFAVEGAIGRERGCETCAIMDALELAIAFAENGHPEYWDVVERFVRNHLLESQCPQTGGFAGHSMPNDYCWLPHATHGPLHEVNWCCSPAGVRALWLAWDRTVTRRDGSVFVNFPLNRVSQYADVMSWLPHEGKVCVIVRDAPDLFVRVPDWVSPDTVRLAVDGGERAVLFDGSYVKITGLLKGSEVLISYPVRRERAAESFLGFTFDVTWRGDTVVAIEPPGANEPLYVRSHMDTDVTPVRAIEPHRASDRTIAW